MDEASSNACLKLSGIIMPCHTPVFTYIDNRIYLDEPIVVNNHIYKISLVNTGSFILT